MAVFTPSASFSALPRGPFGRRQVVRYARLASAHLGQDLLIEVAGKTLLHRQAGRWRVRDWAALLSLGLRFLGG